MLTVAELTGQSTTHLVADKLCRPTVQLQAPVFAAYAAMHKAAAEAGLALDIASGFRDFQRQQAIWNRKYYGETPLYNTDGAQLDYQSLSPGEIVDAIMTWSALPGASRHHWGTDLDVYDPRPFAAGERQLQLIPEEYDEGGPCHELALWLQAHAHDFGFFFPYRRYIGGVAAEPWHLSYRALAVQAQQQLSLEVLTEVLSNADIGGKEYVLSRLAELKERYIDTICDVNGQREDSGWLFG
ncbi:M15 family metallopeptidase [Pseudidiomarina sp. 1ASP75-14]|uniref:M15 family metallopeptidase n=1 Tax=Pseudidiomarina terrestris TaxID=2820060 RepID=UPI00265176C5|nr:M15 family metallopeptidase [Pseudidiomarina sp. 1ASP75-14]MDN7138558.1 M15 family metallopeptidase [Pseudidiomarina sp. 1ASP75-14]